MAVGGVVDQAAPAVVGDHDRRDMAAAEVGRGVRGDPAAAFAGPARAFVEGDDDGCVLRRGPDRRAFDLRDQPAHEGVAAMDQVGLVDAVAVGRDAVAVQPVHVVALVRHDQGEARHCARGEIPFELVEADDLLGPSRIVLNVGEVHEAGVFRGVERGLAGSVVVARIARRHRGGARLGQALVIALPAEAGGRQLVAEMRRMDGVIGVTGGPGAVAHRRRRARVAVVSVVVMDAEGVAAQQGDVVALAGMDLGVEPDRVAARRREP